MNANSVATQNRRKLLSTHLIIKTVSLTRFFASSISLSAIFWVAQKPNYLLSVGCHTYHGVVDFCGEDTLSKFSTRTLFSLSYPFDLLCSYIVFLLPFFVNIRC